MNIIKPLNGFKILDMSRVLAGPWCTQTLGDLGADVIKIEHPHGDDTRQWGPPFYKDPNGNIQTAYFACTNRNKRSIAIDISKDQGQKVIHNLAKECDVVIENFKSGSLKKYNLDYQSLSHINPKIVYCSITGFGLTGPLKDLPGYDFAIQAMGGLMSITGSEDQPYKVGVAVVDLMTGMYANVAIQAALHHRNQTGRGQHIDISLLEVQAAFLANIASSHLVTGNDPKRIGNSHPSISPYDSVKTSDGFIVLAVGNDSQFKSLCLTLGLEPSVSFESPLFLSNSDRVANRPQLLHLITEKSQLWTTDQLVVSLGKANVPCSPVNKLSQVYSHPQIVSRGLVWDIPLKKEEEGEGGNNNVEKQEKEKIVTNDGKYYNLDTLRTVGSPIHFSETNLHTDDKQNTPPPTLGQHTIEICQQLGYTKDEIDKLKDSKIIF
ncbi:CoA-transferase family III protein [Cavenderia fasciculata]|uniref:CoA-transferase family III protein n=1 Tax=Cavenderia fasciculata TaxID=261658 RepID=F4PU71_CACFS|nr:CoA-transferase family III protein [Cavenderia fasciculata]EGG20997.1 CoA-transferase family III protein [Cavenderia fasciculata]|eukprot:XP_004358847.1 CoA-transferase family III protein [Cavenderia fasciculata]